MPKVNGRSTPAAARPLIAPQALEAGESAIALAQSGYWVIPLVPRGKRPALDDWQAEATRDPEKARSWFAACPEYNVGVTTGSLSGVVVLDVDGPEGERSLAALESLHEPLPSGVAVVKTASGRHIYFAAPAQATRNAVKFRPGLDWRGEGGLVVGPGSVHASGAAYTGDPRPVTDLASVPDWLLRVMEAPRRPSGDPSGTTTPLRPLENGEPLPSRGSRNDTLFRMACSWRARSWPIEQALEYAVRFQTAVDNDPSDEFPWVEAAGCVSSAYERYPPGLSPEYRAATRPQADHGHSGQANQRLEGAGRRSWTRVDLTPVLDGSYAPPQPNVGARSDGVGLFYSGRMHTVASESEGGKTWLALLAARNELHHGHAVLYLDFEDDEGGVVGRLLALGTSAAAIRERFAYVRPEQSLEAVGNRDDLTQVVADLRPTLAVLDGVTEAMSLHNLEMKDNTDVARFGQMLPRWLTERGPATVALDHVVKDREQRGRYAIGGVHKLNGLNGAAYVLENRQPFGIGFSGRSTVRIAKDRPGQLRRHALPSAGGQHWFGDLVLRSHGPTHVDAELAPPTERVEEFRPTFLMGRIADALEQHGPLSGKKVESLVRGKAATIRQALSLLQVDGFVSDETPHRLLKPYSDEGSDA